jgi:glycosyltransferase involved in cell wall biosynthesis
MRIAYLLNQYPYVSCTFIRREIIALEACGLDVTRISIRTSEYELIDEADKQEFDKTHFILGEGLFRLLISVLSVAVTRPWRTFKAAWFTARIGTRSDRGLLVHLVYLAEACLVARWCAAHGVAHVHAHFGSNPTTVAMLCHELGGPPYSFTIHGPGDFDGPVALRLGEKVERAAFVAVISSFAKSQVYRWCDHDEWSKIHVIRCAVDESFLGPPSPVPDVNTLVNVGRLGEQKGHLQLIEAARLLAEEGLDFQLVLVGDGPLRPYVESLIARYGLDSKIHITGWATEVEVKQHLISSRAMVLPSFAEGLPVVIMEALALGRPVISTYVSGIPELIEPGVSGWLVPAGSAEATAVAMREALELPVAKLDEMGRAGAKRVAQQHNVSIEARKLAALFRSSCGVSEAKLVASGAEA